MIIQIKDLTESTPLPHLILREEINYGLEATEPLEWQLVEYKDQSSQMEDVYYVLKKKQLFLEFHLLATIVVSGNKGTQVCRIVR
jgi:hypothetical protein